MTIYKGIKGNDWQKQIFGRTGEVQSRDLEFVVGLIKLIIVSTMLIMMKKQL